MTNDADGSAEFAEHDPERGPDLSDSLRTFGAVVQALRERESLSWVAFTERVRFSEHAVESVELGHRMSGGIFVERAEEAMANTGALRKAAQYLSRGEAGLATWFRRWARLEKAVVSLCTYECRLAPGLLQSEGYARAVFGNSNPPLSDGQLEAQFSFIAEEQFLRCWLGGVEVTRRAA